MVNPFPLSALWGPVSHAKRYTAATKAPVKRKRAPKLKPAAVEVVAAEPGTCTTTVSTEETTKNKTKAKKVEKPDEGATTTTPTDELRVLPDSATQAAAAETTCDVAIPESVVKKMDLFQCKMTESVRELTCLERYHHATDVYTYILLNAFFSFQL